MATVTVHHHAIQYKEGRVLSAEEFRPENTGSTVSSPEALLLFDVDSHTQTRYWKSIPQVRRKKNKEQKPAFWAKRIFRSDHCACCLLSQCHWGCLERKMLM
ncbi:uncharacterized protein LOC110598989 [Ictidomys tridecemlineatus]